MSDNGAFDNMGDMKSTLENGSEGDNASNAEAPKRGGEQNFTGRPAELEEATALREKHGYGRRVDYDYTQTSTRSVAKAARYEFTGEIGEVAPEVPALEAELYSKDFLYGKGDRMDILEAAKIEVVGENPVAPADTFKGMGLHPVILSNLAKCHYDYPTAIQRYVMPAIIQGRDIVVSAQTGSGKTVAYLAPVFSKLMGKATTLCAPKWNPKTHDPTVDRYRAEPLLLVILPTRELAWQVFDECRRLSYRSMLRPCVAYGGGPISDQREELQKGCDILIATPGRLKDFLRNPSLLSLARVRYTIVDEADELMHEDWVEDLQQLLNNANMNEDSDHIFMMFSATFPPEYRKVAKKYMSPDYLRIRAGRTGAAHRNVKQHVMWVDGKLKNEALYDVIMSHPPGRTMIFVNSKAKADIIDDFLYNADLPSAALHSDRTQREREDAITGLRDGNVPILVTTGVAARGIDIPNVLHVINYDLPSAMHGGIDEYVHRIGRTARLGHMGLATSFYNERNDDIGEELVKLLMETEQDIPDFLDEFKPADGAPNFDDVESGEESDIGEIIPTNGEANGNSGGAWGAAPANGDANGDSAVNSEKPDADDAW